MMLHPSCNTHTMFRNNAQQCTNMFTNDKQCYIKLKHSYKDVRMMRNLLLRCTNNVTMCKNVPTHVHDVTIIHINVQGYVTSCYDVHVYYNTVAMMLNMCCCVATML